MTKDMNKKQQNYSVSSLYTLTEMWMHEAAIFFYIIIIIKKEKVINVT